MGLINWFLKRKINKNFATMPEDKLGVFVTEYLKRTQKEHADALRVSQNLNKAALMDLQTKKLKSEMKNLLNTDDEEEDEEEDEGNFGDNLVKDLISQFIKSRAQQPQDNLAPAAPSTSQIEKIAASLSPTQKKMIKDKLGIDL